jgi:hypothetical protein
MRARDSGNLRVPGLRRSESPSIVRQVSPMTIVAFHFVTGPHDICRDKTVQQFLIRAAAGNLRSENI